MSVGIPSVPVPTWGVLLNPGLLVLGGVLVGVPILIHLLSRRRVQRIPWAAMQWLLAAMKRHQRRLRLENWLILLLRIIAVILLGLALARPILTDPDLAGMFAGRTNLYLVVDTSYSMGAQGRGRPVIDVAKAEADAILSGLGEKDTVAVLTTNDPRISQSDGRTPFVLLPRTVTEDGATRAKEAIATLRPRDAPADWAAALERVSEQTATEDSDRLVVLVTDFQGRDWREERVRQALGELTFLPSAVRIVDVGGRDRRNLTVAEVRNAMRRDVFVGRPTQLEVVVENQGTDELDGARISVFRDQEPTPLATERIREPIPGADPQTGRPGSVSTRIQLPGRALPEPGARVLNVRVEPPTEDAGADTLALDSSRGLAVEVRDRIRVLAWARDSEGASLKAETYLRGVYDRVAGEDVGAGFFEGDPLYEFRAVGSETQLADAIRRGGPRAPDLLVLANAAPRGLAAESVRAFVEAGGALVVFTGDKITDPAMLNAVFHDDQATRILPRPFGAPELRARGDAGTPFRFDLRKETGHPLAEPFTGADAIPWIGEAPPLIWGRLAFDPTPTAPTSPEDGDESQGDDANGDVVLYFADGKPAVVEGRLGLGRTLWVATSIDSGWFERAVPFFLPVFLDEAAVYLTRPDAARRNLEVGRRIVVTWLPADAVNVRFTAPGGTQTTPTRYEGRGEADRAMFVQNRVGTAGTWRLEYEREGSGGEVERVEERFAVNPDPGEGHLARASSEALLGVVPPGTEGDLRVLDSWSNAADRGNEARRGEISTHLLWIALAILALESVLAWQFGRRGRPGTAGKKAGSVG